MREHRSLESSFTEAAPQSEVHWEIGIGKQRWAYLEFGPELGREGFRGYREQESKAGTQVTGWL